MPTKSTDSASILPVHVTPRSGRDCIQGVDTRPSQAEVRIRVTAAPEGGKANAAVCKLLAKALGVPKTSLKVVSGESSRHKRIALPLTEEELDDWIARLNSVE